MLINVNQEFARSSTSRDKINKAFIANNNIIHNAPWAKRSRTHGVFTNRDHLNDNG